MTDAEKKEYLPQIAATLKYGAFYGGKRKRNIILFSIFTLVMLGGMVGGTIGFSLMLADGELEINEFVLILIGFSGLFIALPVLFLVLLIKDELTRKKILLWLDDAVETGAYSYLFGTSSISNGRGQTRTYKIKIKFKIDGKHISCFSKGKYNGYSPYWNKYADKEVKILYSPKYEEVMILK